MSAWLTNLFVHPEFILPGAALLSLPVIIHLINRMRYRRVKWAAMEFLLASQQRNRRRLLLEQLLLLLLRMVAVAGLVVLLARPLVNPDQFFLFQGQKTHHLVLVDDSGSMRDRWGETSAFDEALKVIRRIAAEGERKPDTQTLTLILLSDPEQPVFTQQNLNKEFSGRLETRLKGLRCSHRALDLAAGVEGARKLLAEQKGAARNFHLVSDFREHDWAEDAALALALREMESEKIAINLVRTVAESHANLGITELSGAVDVAAVNVPVPLSVTVHNYGEEVIRDVRLTIVHDGVKQATTIDIDQLDPGKSITRPVPAEFTKTGPHYVQVSLLGDALEADNHRFISLDVPEANRILIIDGGESNAGAVELADALSPLPGMTGFAPTVKTLEFPGRQPLSEFQSIFLLNIPELPPDALRALEHFVSEGGGLAWFVGDQVRAPFYNDKLYQDGKGLFPTRLGSASDLLVDETNPAPDLVVGSFPVFELFQGLENPIHEQIRINRYFTVARDWTPPDGVQIIATLRNHAPLMLEHRHGKGVILTCLTATGGSWNNWPRIPQAFVTMQLEFAKRIARRQALEGRRVGEPISLTLDAAVFTPNVEIQPPGSPRVDLTLGVGTGTGNEGAGGGGSTGIGPRVAYEGAYRDTDQPGLYTVKIKPQTGDPRALSYAYNVPESESRLKLAPTSLIKRKLGSEMRVQIQEAGDFSWVRGEESTRDIHDWVLGVLLAILLFEQALALRLSYHPKSAGAQA